MAEDNSQASQPKFKVKITRSQFILLNIIFLIVFGGSFIFFLFKDPTNIGLIVGIVIVWMIAGYTIRIFRFNDISADTQNKLLGSGNMFLVAGWLPFIAPSASSSEEQLNEVATAMGDRSTRMKLMGRNLLRLFIVFVILIAGVFVYNYILLSSHEKALENLPPKTANFVLSLGNNHWVTMSQQHYQ